MATAATLVREDQYVKILKFPAMDVTDVAAVTEAIAGDVADYAVIYAVKVGTFTSNGSTDGEMNIRALNAGGSTQCAIRPYYHRALTTTAAGDIGAEEDVCVFTSGGNTIGSVVKELPASFVLQMSVACSATAFTADVYVELHRA